MTDDDDILCAEYALGLLDADESALVAARAAAEPAIAARVAWWHDRLSDLAPPAQPADADRLWARIAAAVPANDDAPADRTIRALKLWRAAALASMMLAVALGAALVMRPAPIDRTDQPARPLAQAKPAAIMIAVLDGDAGNHAMAVFNPAAARLTVAPRKVAVGTGAAELWVIGSDKVPHSLGVVDHANRSAIILSPELTALLKAGATLAISREAPGGSTTGLPTGPVIATGSIVTG